MLDISAAFAPAATAGDTLTNFPPSFSYDGLSVLLCRSIASLQADKCRKPWTLPPACVIPGSKAPVWLLADVLAWLAQYREPARQRPPEPAEPPRRGRPTKREQIERQRAAAARQGSAA
ncbi:DNA-binding protein [Diaphorobacter sp.]|uniref:DNA-binding protein n=1 Tax=Diaphorobacter sp. TaxID=1934310 RepID=UPI00258755D2|nr:DNA-binding protein [Diaphorobacter sp.]